MLPPTNEPLTRTEFSRLVQHHIREFVVYAHTLTGDRHSAQDIVQDAYITAYRKVGSFHTSSDFAAWVRGIIRFKAREWFRAQKRVPAPVADTEIDGIDGLLDAFHQEEAQGVPPVFVALEECIASLPVSLREAVEAFYLKDQTGEPAAGSLGISGALLRKRLQRARGQLFTCIQKKSA